MSTKQAVTMASRALAVYCLLWFLADFTYMPTDLLSFWHYRDAYGAITGTTYLRNYHVLYLAARLLRMVLLFFAMQWLYRSGPAVQRYFLASTEEAPEGE
ncbi:MAG: hypothetical protein HY010_00890 [Acidobacteria bacterium]|nr:hypothetical protein [Acidobacteriota bacterium]